MHSCHHDRCSSGCEKRGSSTHRQTTEYQQGSTEGNGPRMFLAPLADGMCGLFGRRRPTNRLLGCEGSPRRRLMHRATREQQAKHDRTDDERPGHRIPSYSDRNGTRESERLAKLAEMSRSLRAGSACCWHSPLISDKEEFFYSNSSIGVGSSSTETGRPLGSSSCSLGSMPSTW
jgi:hypothetical protein